MKHAVDILFRVFNNPPVIDIFKTVTRDLLLVGATPPIRILDRVVMSMGMKPALSAKCMS